ncbi:hypothetical protein ACE6H2_022840 [Prunus campanulata]
MNKINSIKKKSAITRKNKVEEKDVGVIMTSKSEEDDLWGWGKRKAEIRAALERLISAQADQFSTFSRSSESHAFQV